MAWSKNPEKKPGTSSSIKIQSTFWGKAIFEGSIQAKKRGLSEQRNWLRYLVKVLICEPVLS
jgi:hypothetical protein